MGKFIVIEGSDASGKKTQFDLLEKQLKKEKHKVKTFDFPRYDSYYGKIIGRYLDGKLGNINKVDPYFISMIYGFDRLEVRDDMIKALKNNIVLCNRYTASNKAHQSAKFKKGKEEFIKWIDYFEYKINKLPKADLTIFLYVPFRISEKLAENKRKRTYTQKKKDIHEKDKPYMNEVEKTYLEFSKDRTWKKIDCTENNKILSREEIHKKVWKEVKKLL